jgi:hypothetical protein
MREYRHAFDFVPCVLVRLAGERDVETEAFGDVGHGGMLYIIIIRVLQEAKVREMHMETGGKGEDEGLKEGISGRRHKTKNGAREV